MKDLVGDSGRCNFTSNWSVLTVNCYWKVRIILSLSQCLFQLPAPVSFLVMAQILSGPFVDLIQPINLTEKVSTFFHWINCPPGSAMDWIMEKSDGYQNWWKVHSARVKEAGAGFLWQHWAQHVLCDLTLRCSLMICRLWWQSWPSPSCLFMYHRSFRAVLVSGLFFVRITSSLTNSCIGTSEGMRNCDASGTGRINWPRAEEELCELHHWSHKKTPNKNLIFPILN